jgi:hypothetical protein
MLLARRQHFAVLPVGVYLLSVFIQAGLMPYE